jgi:O-antigen/teichoic acid export membrane protein
MTDVIGKAMSFILLPIVSYFLPPSELGIATNFTVLTTLIILLAGLAIVNSIPYFFYEQEKDENISLISNLLALCLGLSLVVGAVAACFSQQIYDHLQLDLHIQMLGVVFVIASMISNINLTLLRLENNPKHFAVLQIVQIVLHAVFVVLFVIVLRGGGVGKIYAEVMVFCVIGLIHLAMLLKKGYVRLRLQMAWMRKLLHFGLPLLPHSISFWLKSGMDKVFITTYCGLQFNGLYSMAISVSSVYTMLMQSFFNAYTPYLQKRLASFDGGQFYVEKRNIVKQIYLIYALFGVVGFLAIAASWVIFHYLIDSKYLPAMSFIPLIILANFIYTFYSFTIEFIYKVKKTMVMGIITFTGSLIQMLLSYVLIKEYGVMGAVYSLVIGNTLITIGISVYSNMVYRMPWLLGKIDS